jgi:hypothetical protein
MVVLTAAALACTSAPSLAQAGPEPAASSQGLLEEPGFIIDSLVIPEGFTAENISGYYLEHDLATDTWSAEFVFESDFTENGYVGSGTTSGGGGGYTGRQPDGGFANGGSVLDDGVMLSAGKQVATSRTTVTKTTSSSWTVKFYGWIPIITWTQGGTVTTTTDSKVTIRGGRLTGNGAEGFLPPAKDSED